MILGGCKLSNITILSGNYATCTKSPLKSIFLEKKLKVYVGSMRVLDLQLRPDSSYILGTCDYQILEAGNYLFIDDSLLLHNRFNFKVKEKIPMKRYFYDKEENEIYFLLKNTNMNFKYPQKLTILKKDCFKHHKGFLRNQEWSLDLLYKYNEVYSYERQMSWQDSTYKARITEEN